LNNLVLKIYMYTICMYYLVLNVTDLAYIFYYFVTTFTCK